MILSIDLWPHHIGVGIGSWTLWEQEKMVLPEQKPWIEKNLEEKLGKQA